jgi:hypothetical protein
MTTITAVLFVLIACFGSALLGCFSKKLRNIANYMASTGTLKYLWIGLATTLLGAITLIAL